MRPVTDETQTEGMSVLREAHPHTALLEAIGKTQFLSQA